MQTFATSREAKEFLVGRILEEAHRENMPLSEVEKKMLYFSETTWTLPDIAEAKEAFDREYDQGEYEQKIASLISRFCADARANNPFMFNRWTEAVRAISKEDHYLLVMIAEAGAMGRPRGDFLKLLATALVIVGVFVAIVFWTARR